ncbi:MAG: ACT domain-containing protein [Candidatus Nanopelagicales bacterium]
MPSIAVTVVGHDRPGIVHRVTAVIAARAGNLEDSSMSLLRGHFAMTLIADIPDPDAATLLDADLADLALHGLTVSVVEVPAHEVVAAGVAATVAVHGADRPGIVRAATEVVLAFDGNIVDLSTRLGADLYVLTAEVIFPVGTDLDAVRVALRTRMAELGVTATLHAADEDLL